MIRWHRLGTLLIVGALCTASRAGTPSANLAARMATAPSTPIAVIAYLTDTAPHVSPVPVRAAIRDLKQRAHARQGPLVKSLASRRARRIRPLWVVNAVAFRAAPAVVRAIAARPDVRIVEADPLQPGLPPAPAAQADAMPSWNIEHIFADTVWSEGFRGEGVRVGVMDTGVDAAQPALAGKMAPGGWRDFVGRRTTPYDDNGHGTHVTGIICGGEINGTAIGVAPGATYLAAKVLGATNQFSGSTVLEAGQWLLDPNGDGDPADAPDIVNCSWVYDSRAVTDFHTMLVLWRAAGILPVFAIGNSGPSASSALSPGSDPLAIGVGATTSTDAVADFSSRGPAPANPPFNGVLKPDIVAPGVNVGSAKRGGGILYMSGTSMASPHVAGALALLRQRFPGISFRDAWYRITKTAKDLGAAGADNVSGYGLLNIYAAIHLAAIPGDTDGDGIVTPADAALALRIGGGLAADKTAVPRGDIAAPAGRLDARDAVAILRWWSGS
jgi:bacillopeptidase F